MGTHSLCPPPPLLAPPPLCPPRSSRAQRRHRRSGAGCRHWRTIIALCGGAAMRPPRPPRPPTTLRTTSCDPQPPQFIHTTADWGGFILLPPPAMGKNSPGGGRGMEVLRAPIWGGSAGGGSDLSPHCPKELRLRGEGCPCAPPHGNPTLRGGREGQEFGGGGGSHCCCGDVCMDPPFVGGALSHNEMCCPVPPPPRY